VCVSHVVGLIVLTVESASFTKLLQSLTISQVVVAVSHDDMQSQ